MEASEIKSIVEVDLWLFAVLFDKFAFLLIYFRLLLHSLSGRVGQSQRLFLHINSRILRLSSCGGLLINRILMF